MDWKEPASRQNSFQVNNKPDTQYSVFWRKVKYIMLCMVLWRLREYPVDKSEFISTNGASNGSWLFDFLHLKNTLIKKYYFVKKCIKKLNRYPLVSACSGVIHGI